MVNIKEPMFENGKANQNLKVLSQYIYVLLLFLIKLLNLLKGWLRKATEEQTNKNDLKEAYCSICECVLRAHHGDLIQHAKTIKHITKRNSFLQPKLKSFGKIVYTKIFTKLILKLMSELFIGIHSDSYESKKNDIKLSVHIAAHSAINSIDHLGEILTSTGKGSIFEKTRLHRTKCSKIILNVVSPTLLEDIVADIGENRYSLIVDESTDVSITKYMAYCVRYYSKNLKSITTEFLGLVMIERATAIDLRDGTLDFLKTIQLKPEKIIGLGVDGASNLCGRHNSLYTLLKEISPKLQLIKCICHSLNLCSSKAAEILPAHIEYMLRESVSWFSHSTLRKIEYSRLYKTINGDGSQQKQLVKLCATRWLAFHNCIKVVVDQWLELQTCFKLASISKKEKCHTARTLSEMYNDENLLYFVFLKPILREITNVNIQFQANNADHTKTYGELKMLLLSIAKRIIKPIFLRNDEFSAVSKALQNPLAFLPLEAIDYGHSFQILAEKNTIQKNALHQIKERCLHYMTSICHELVKRLPHNISIIEKLKYFSPLLVLSSTPPKFSDLPLELAGKLLNY